jgi:hypothetical protein
VNLLLSDPAFLSVAAGGAALWTPANITTTIWLDASDASTVTLSGSLVTSWNDKSGNSHNFAAQTGNEPAYQLTSQNGLNTINFANVGTARQYLTNTSFQYASDEISLFSVHRNLSVSGPYRYGRLFAFASTSGADYNNTDGLALLYGVTSGIALYRNSATIATTGAINDAWCIVDAERSQGTGRIALNGGTYATGTTSTANQNIQRSRIGNDYSLSDSGVNGFVGEQIVIVGSVLASDRLKLQGYLAHKWGLAGNLPVTHPYKSVAPTA